MTMVLTNLIKYNIHTLTLVNIHAHTLYQQPRANIVWVGDIVDALPLMSNTCIIIAITMVLVNAIRQE